MYAVFRINKKSIDNQWQYVLLSYDTDGSSIFIVFLVAFRILILNRRCWCRCRVFVLVLDVVDNKVNSFVNNDNLLLLLGDDVDGDNKVEDNIFP